MEKAMAPHSSTLAWKIPWPEEPGGLQSVGSRSRTWLRDFTFTFHFYALEKEMATHSSVLAWRIPGTGSHRFGHDWSDLAAAVASIFHSYLMPPTGQRWYFSWKEEDWNLNRSIVPFQTCKVERGLNLS